MGEAIDRLRAGMDPIAAGHYLIGLSGGADSVALLMILLTDIRKGSIRAEAVHVNHGLRGAESDADEQFAADLCRREGIPLHVYRADLHGRRDEDAARKARLDCFRRCLAETGAQAVMLAHQADDQAETVLMRLLRGAGPDGLGGMKKAETTAGIPLIRPLLHLRRSEIREALRADGIAWREDSSNDDRGYLRNRIRMELIPEMEKISGEAVSRICLAARLTGLDNDALSAEASELFDSIRDGDRIDANALAKAPEALQGRVLRLWWRENGPEMKERSLNARQTAELMRLLTRSSGKANLPGNYYAVRGERFLHFTGGQTADSGVVPVTGPETRFGGMILRSGPSEGNPGNGRISQEVPEGFTEGCVIRTRRPGDRIRPFGSSGSRKLQDYLTDRRVDEPFRDQIPLLCRGNEVLLVCGIGAGGIPKWDESRPNLRLTWQGKIPWMK